MLTLTSIWVFILLPLPWLMYWLLPAAKNQTGQALRLPFFHQISQFTSSAKPKGFMLNSLRHWLAILIWILLILAASGPTWLGETIHIPQSGRDLMLAVDLSESMRLPDMQLDNQPVDRLTAIKSVANDFIDQRKGDRLGLILFGSRAYLQTPLTFDRDTVKQMLNDSSIGLAGPQTAIGDAIGLAIKRLLETKQQSRVLVLLTDGANNSGNVSPLDAAKMAEKYGIRIHTIGFGAESLLLQGLYGPQKINPSADLDENTLQQIATLSGGKYFRAKDTATLDHIYKMISQLEPVDRDDILLRPQIPLYPWPLAAALLLSLCLALRRINFRHGLQQQVAK